MKKCIKKLNERTPNWFKEWHSSYFLPTESRSSRNERLIYILLATVLGLNTAGNWYHEDIIRFFLRLFGEG